MAQHQIAKPDWHFELEDKDLERFFLKVDFPDENGCMAWRATRTKGGYGKLMLKGEKREAHRIAYVSFVGPTDGSLVLHKCNYSSCVNIDHLYLGDNCRNMKDLTEFNDKNIEHNPKLYKTKPCNCGCEYRYYSTNSCFKCNRANSARLRLKQKSQQPLEV